MSKGFIRIAALALAGAAVPSQALLAAPTEFTPADWSAIDTMAAELLLIASRTPDEQAQREAQFALAIDRSKLRCPVLLASIDRALIGRVNRVTRSALIRVRQTVSRCRPGTAALDGYSISFATPGFAIGGGTDYNP